MTRSVKREDRMEVDGATVNALSTEEKQRLVKEGKCFTCKKTGHQSRNCPNKDNAPSIARGGARAAPGTSVRAAEVEGKKEEKKQELTKSIKTMTAEERNELLDDLVLAGF